MATIYIDNKPCRVKDGQNLLAACLGLGLDLPYFCWHPAMDSVGACRQCAIKLFADENDKRGRIVMACMTPARDGARISIEDAEARDFRARMIELLMTNHPHDCPVCDEGGECHLQDMTVMTGHDYRRFRFAKRTHYNQDLGPFVTHEMNRCIQCYRCVRFYRDYAGGRDFEVMAWHNHVYFGRHESGTLQSEFAGNLVEICPTGVFTDKTLAQHYTRKWDLQQAPSVCVHCGLGCNTIGGERYGMLRRLRARYNHDVNRYFLCDRGRYGYEFVNSPRRIRRPRDRLGNSLTKTQALHRLQDMTAAGAIGIGSPRASLEANFALRELVGQENFHSGMSDGHTMLMRRTVETLRSTPAQIAGLHEVEHCDAVLILGEDPTATAPLLDLSVRQAARQQLIVKAMDLTKADRWNDMALREVAQDQHGPIYIATPAATKLDAIATAATRQAPLRIAELGFAVAHAIDESAPAAADAPPELLELAARIAADLLAAELPLVIAGSSCGQQALLDAAANVALALHRKGKNAWICLTAPECNSMGLALMQPALLSQATGALKDGRADTLIIVENDLYRRAPKAQVDELLEAARNVVVLDHLENATTARAHLVLPAATFAECSGTLVNNESRAQRFYQVFEAGGDVQASWRWLAARKDTGELFAPVQWESLDQVDTAMARTLEVFDAVTEIAPPAWFRINNQQVPRQGARYSGRTAITADQSVHEPAPPPDVDSPLAFSMEGYQLPPSAPLTQRFWWPGWNSIQALNKFQQEIDGPLRGGPCGKRLLQSGQGHAGYNAPPVAPGDLQQQFLVVGAWHTFGSEELSVVSQGVSQLAPKPYIGLCRDDAQALGLSDGRPVRVQVAGHSFNLPLRIMDGAKSLALLPVGLPDVPYVELPAAGMIAPAGGAP